MMAPTLADELAGDTLGVQDDIGAVGIVPGSYTPPPAPIPPGDTSESLSPSSASLASSSSLPGATRSVGDDMHHLNNQSDVEADAEPDADRSWLQTHVLVPAALAAWVRTRATCPHHYPCPAFLY